MLPLVMQYTAMKIIFMEKYEGHVPTILDHLQIRLVVFTSYGVMNVMYKTCNFSPVPLQYGGGSIFIFN